MHCACGKYVIGAHEHTHQFGDWMLFEDVSNTPVYKRSCACGKYEFKGHKRQSKKSWISKHTAFYEGIRAGKRYGHPIQA